jgi:hypothetical protein
MRRHDFTIVSQALSDSKPRRTQPHPAGGLDAREEQWRAIVGALADAFEAQTHTFERARFLRDCGHTLPPPRS